MTEQLVHVTENGVEVTFNGAEKRAKDLMLIFGLKVALDQLDMGEWVC